MSLKSELQEVVDWLSDLTAGSQPTPEPVYREDWYLVRDNLRKAAEHFHDAIAALEKNHSSLVDFARDLEREAEGLSLRAESLARRSPKKPPADDATAALMKQLEEKQKELKATEKKLHDMTKELEAAKTPAGPATIAPAEAERREETEEEPEPSDFVNDAAESLERAHRHIVEDGDAPPDAVADAFANRLELLSEMTLSLRLQLEPDEQQAAKKRAKEEAAKAAEQATAAKKAAAAKKEAEQATAAKKAEPERDQPDERTERK